jgi:hypothetical protein
MCTFIIAVVPPDAQLELLKIELKAHRLGFRIFEEAAFLAQLPPDDVAFYTTYGFCDCGTELGSGYYRDQQEQRQHEKEEAKRRRQGWSETKLARWRAEREAQQEKRRERDNEQGHGEMECFRWVHFLNTILSRCIVSRIGVFVLDYSRKPSPPSFASMSQIRVRLSDITPDFLRYMKEHTLYEFSL